VTAPVHVPLAVLLVRYHIPSASPFLPICSTASPWFRVCVARHSSIYVCPSQVCSVVGGSHAVDQGGHALADGIQQLRRHIHAGHHVLEDERLVLQFSPLARREGSATSSSVAHRRAVVVLQKLLRRLHLVHALLFRRSPSPTQCRCASSGGLVIVMVCCSSSCSLVMMMIR
jgi:hypothetical protein